MGQGCLGLTVCRKLARWEKKIYPELALQHKHAVRQPAGEDMTDIGALISELEAHNRGSKPAFGMNVYELNTFWRRTETTPCSGRPGRSGS